MLKLATAVIATVVGGIWLASILPADPPEKDNAVIEGVGAVPIEQRPLAPFDLAAERARLQKAAPDHIIIGDSMLWTRLGLNADEHLNPLSGQRFYFITRSGLSPAGCYLVVKNIIAKSGLRPHTITVIYRDFLLTMPTYRTSGRYRPVLASLTDGPDPLLSEHMRRSWDTHWNTPARWLAYQLRGDDGWLAFTQQSSAVQRSVQNLAMRLQADGSREKRALRSLLDERFTLAHLRQDLAADMGEDDEGAASAEDLSVTSATSFVPAMAAAADALGSRLIFYRVKRRPKEARGFRPQSPSALDYAQRLHSALDQLKCRYFDETPDLTLKPDQYSDGDHLKETERAGYASYFFTNLRPLLD